LPTELGQGAASPGTIGRIALFGYAISYVPLIGAFWVGFVHDPYVVLLGLVGAVPSAVCSWLAAERWVAVSA
jgi:hypothetical protein